MELYLTGCTWPCVGRAEDESESGVKSPVGSDSTNDKEHKEVSSQEATDDDASNDSDVIITGEETAPLWVGRAWGCQHLGPSQNTTNYTGSLRNVTRAQILDLLTVI